MGLFTHTPTPRLAIRGIVERFGSGVSMREAVHGLLLEGDNTLYILSGDQDVLTSMTQKGDKVTLQVSQTRCYYDNGAGPLVEHLTNHTLDKRLDAGSGGSALARFFADPDGEDHQP